EVSFRLSGVSFDAELERHRTAYNDAINILQNTKEPAKPWSRQELSGRTVRIRGSPGGWEVRAARLERRTQPDSKGSVKELRPGVVRYGEARIRGPGCPPGSGEGPRFDEE